MQILSKLLNLHLTLKNKGIGFEMKKTPIYGVLFLSVLKTIICRRFSHYVFFLRARDVLGLQDSKLQWDALQAWQDQ